MEEEGVVGRWGPVAVMVTLSLAFGVGNALAEKALHDGLDGMVLVTVRQLLAAVFLGPIAFFQESCRNNRPKLTWRVFFYLFTNAFVGGSLAQYLYYLGMQYTSATYACAFLNLLPLLTFLLAVALRSEKVNLKEIIGRVKLLSAVICLAGVVVLICYRGAPLTHTARETMGGGGRLSPEEKAERAKRWVVGSLLLLACCLCWTAWFLLQSLISKIYPLIYSCNTIMFLLGFLQATALTLATKRGLPLSTMKGTIAIITVVYSGLVSSALGFLAMTWCVARRGPVFPSVFTPLVQMFAGILDFSVLKLQPLFSGSVLGSVLVILGLYLLLWAKMKELERVEVKPMTTEEEEEKEENKNKNKNGDEEHTNKLHV